MILNQQHKTSIGGQAVIEGIMMRGPKKTAMAVRVPDQSIDVEIWETKSPNAWYKKAFFVRGIFNMVDTLKLGYRCLMKSADKAGFEEEPSAFEKKMKAKMGKAYEAVFQGFILIVSMVIALSLFMFLPVFLVSFLKPVISTSIVLTLIEGVLKIGIFVLYLFAVSRMKDIQRVFEYHGAEHKTIFCYESGKELTIENIRAQSRFHPRCGTSFLLIVLVISILVFSVVTWGSIWIRFGIKILCLPLVVGIAYEIIKLAGKYDNVCTRIISAPGMWLQRLTTREPDDSQIEVAIESMKPVIPENQEEAKW